MKKYDAKQITLAALTMAIVCVSTMIIQIPIPLGYMHLGNCCILLIGVFFSKTIGTLAGGVGSALADLLSGYPQWIFPTLIIKGIMGYAIASLSKDKDGHVKMASWRTFAASVVGILIMIIGYTIAGTFLYGSVASGLAQIPGLSLEGVLGIVLFYAAGFAFEAAKLPRLFNSQKNA